MATPQLDRTAGATHYAPPTVPLVQPLVDGDRMEAEEFWLRYEAAGEHFKAELIDGIVSLKGTGDMASPISLDHSDPHLELSAWVHHYRRQTPGVRATSETTVRINVNNTPQPDLCLYRVPPRVPTSPIVGRYLTRAPELAIEIARSSVRRDTGAKLRMYEAAGTLEYIVWRVEAGIIDWWTRDGDRFVELRPDADGISRSRAFPGLWLDTAAMIASNEDAVEAAERAGTSSPEHAAFAALSR